MRSSRVVQMTALVCAGAAAAVTAASPWAGAKGSAHRTAPASVTATTAINSAAYVNLVVADARRDGLSEKDAHRLARCLVKEYTKYGAKTVGDLENNQPAAKKIAKACGAAVGIVGKLERAKAAAAGKRASASSSGTPGASPAKPSARVSSVTG